MASPLKSPYKRSSISSLFPNLTISPTVSSSTIQDTNPPIAKALYRTLRTKYPHWGSVRGEGEQDARAKFTIKMALGYDYYFIEEDPDELFEETNGFFGEIESMMTALSKAQADVFDDYMSELFSELVFGSNFIESAGSTYDITIRICQQIFSGQIVKADIPETDPDYQQSRLHLIQCNLHSSHQMVIRSRREIIQHALALRHIITQMILRNGTLTDELIKSTHQILCTGVDTPEGDDSTTYAGKYRTCEVTAGFTSFTLPDSISAAMKSLVIDFNQDVCKAEEKEALDPYALASKYCHKFVNVHPFLDGNGRTCRLILSAILLKYAGIVVPLGKKEQDREDYLAVAVMGSEAEQIEEDDRTKPAWSGLMSLIIKKATIKMATLRNKLNDV